MLDRESFELLGGAGRPARPVTIAARDCAGTASPGGVAAWPREGRPMHSKTLLAAALGAALLTTRHHPRRRTPARSSSSSAFIRRIASSRRPAWGRRLRPSPGRAHGSCVSAATRWPSRRASRACAASAGRSRTWWSTRSQPRTTRSGARCTGCSGSVRPLSGMRTGSGSFPAAGGVPVGIVDTGVDAGHEDLAGKVSACGAAADGVVTDGDCADSEGHGSHVAGTIGALANNRAGVTGVAFNSPLIICRALGGSDGSGTVADVAACIRWVHVRGAKVISMSLGGPASHTLAEAAKTAYARGGRSGSLLVAAAGNDGDGDDRVSGGPGPGRLGRCDRRARRRRCVLQRERRCGDRGARRRHPLGKARRRLRAHVRHLDGDAARRRRGSAAVGTVPVCDRRTTIRRRLDAAVDDLGAPGRDPAYGYGVVDLAR